MNELDAFCEVVRRLEAGGFEYMVTGSWAMNYWAINRATRDIDLVVALAPSDTDRFVDAFSGQDFHVDADVARAEIGRRGVFNILYEPFLLKFDIIVQKGDLYSRSAFRRRFRVEGAIDCGTGFWISSPEDLVLAKLAWYREGNQQDGQQLDDVVNVLTCQDAIDVAYLDEWADLLDLRKLLGIALKAAQAEKDDDEDEGGP